MLIIVAIALIVSTFGGAVQVNAAAPPTPTKQASAYAYMTATKWCIQNGLGQRTDGFDLVNFGNQSSGYWHDKITQENVKSGTWWQDSFTVAPSFLLGTTGTDSKAKCNDVLKAGISLWGYGSDYLSLMCDFVAHRDNGSSCATGADDLFGNISTASFAKGFEKAVENKLGNGTLTAASPELYVLYQAAFFSSKGCKAVPSTSPGKNFAYTNIKTVDPSTGKVTSTTYEGLAHDTGLTVYVDGSLNWINKNCSQIADALNANAGAYSAWITQYKTPDSAKPSNICKDNPSDPSCKTNPSAPTCGDAVEGIGWIICPVFNFMGMLDDAMWNFTSALLTVSPLQHYQIDAATGQQTTTTTPVFNTWNAFLQIANVSLVIVFLIIVFSQLTGAGISNYGVKKMLPRLIVAAILINASFYVMQIVVDVFNILGSSLFNFVNTFAKFDPSSVSWTKLGGTVAGMSAVELAAGIGIAGATIAPGAVFAIMLPAAAAGAIGFLAALAVLILRQALIPILVVLAPIAFVAYLLPNTKSWFDKWKNALVAMLLLYPIAALLFSGVKLAAAIVANEDSWWSILVALIIMSVPLFMLPFVARQAGPMLGKFGGAVNGWRKGARGLTSKATDPIKKRSIAQARNNVPLWGAISRRRTRTNLETQAYEAQHTAEFNRELASHPEWAGRVQGDAAQAYIRGATSRAEAEELKTALQPLIREIAQVRASGGNVDTFLEGRATSSTHTAAERNAAMHQAAALGRDGVIRNLERNPAVDQTAVREAIGANAGALLGKAPDIVKGPEAAFDTVRGSQMADFSAGTAREHMRRLEELHTKATAPGATAADQQALNNAVSAFNSAVEDIKNDSTLQAKFGADTGRAIEEAIASSGPAFQTYAASTTDMVGLVAIQPDGKIR